MSRGAYKRRSPRAHIVTTALGYPITARVVEIGLRPAKPMRTHKRRGGQGNRNGSAKLYAKDVRWVRKVCVPRSAEFSYTALARKLGVSAERIREIVLGRAWKHLL